MSSQKKSAFLFWFKGWFWLFENPRYLWLVLAPWILGMALIVPIFIYMLPLFPDYSQNLTEFVMNYSPADFLTTFIGITVYWILFVLMLIFLATFGFIFFYCVYILICPPFYSILVGAVLKNAGKITSPSITFKEWLYLTTKLFVISLMKGFIFLILGIVGFLVSFIPGLNFMGFVIAAVVVAFDSMDYSFEALNFGFGERFGYFSRHKDQLLTMSLSMGLTLLIPGLTFLALPGAVVGAALIVHRMEIDPNEKSDQSSREPS